jgi:type III pantothenate kinase
MNSGIYFGYISLINGLIEKIQQELGQEMKIIITGGLAEIFSDKIDNLERIEKKLTLEGLNYINKILKNI